MTMTNTPMTFEEWAEKKYGWNKPLNILENKKDYSEFVMATVFYAWEAWQANQAHNDAVIAELREDFLDLRKQVNYRCADVQRLTELNAELVEALEDASKEFKKLPHSLGYDITHCKRYDKLIAKHKKV